ncbi:MAG: 4Fe-4S dicluster domain-containing protein [Bacteroidales bacterium]|nr:4Fe-4S binding protein [Bacteroidales bacterium]MDZ4203793.1 4Fe-4S dicluster domain-containing protein [Bacteroidales bacterium]
MAKKLIIDLTKCRTCEECVVECLYDHHPVNHGMKSLLEMAAFQFTCRRCEDAPCIEVCPPEALERNNEGIVERALNLCIACKSCVTVCPFGTLMNHFFEVRQPICDLCDFNELTKSLKCIDTCPKGALSFTEFVPDDKKHILELNERVLVKEYAWEKLKQN